MKTKQEAAEHLGVGIRAVERYAEQGKLTVKYERGKTRPIAMYDEQELAKLKKEVESSLNPALRPQVVKDASTAIENSANTENPASGVLIPANARQMFSMMVEAFAKASVKKQEPAIADLAAKPILKLSEAARLTGFGRETLLEAHREGKLKMQIIKRAWRIKSTDLHKYVEKL